MAWPGATVYRSVDDGTSYSPSLTHVARVTMGRAVTALGHWTGGNRWDDDSHVDVLLSRGTFSSATDLGVLNGMNVVAVASGAEWEIVQFANAELIATNTWRLSRLLRGRIGTERAMAGHAVNDRVVLLSQALRRLPVTLADVGAARLYKPVTAGQAVGDVAARAVTLAGNALRSLSPVHITGTRDAGDLTIAWIRRARINADWRDRYDVPLDEPSEAYEIDILDGDEVVRTLTAETTSVEYTAEQQTIDFGAPQASVDVRIYQISHRVGRGHPGRATI